MSRQQKQKMGECMSRQQKQTMDIILYAVLIALSSYILYIALHIKTMLIAICTGMI